MNLENIEISNLKEPKYETLRESYMLLKLGLESVDSFYKLYQLMTRKRGRGAPAHADQDLLRAMVVIAGATLDTTLKQLIKDSYREIIHVNETARKKAAQHLHRRILNRLEQHGNKLAELLLADDFRYQLAEQIAEDLTGGSLQSVEEIN